MISSAGVPVSVLDPRCIHWDKLAEVPRRWVNIGFYSRSAFDLGRDKDERVGPLAGVSVFGLDALSSAAYGPEAALIRAI
jgi:hypothetical protein